MSFSAAYSRHLPFALPHADEEMIGAVVEALRFGWLSTGPRTRAIEAAFKDFVGGGCEAVPVNSVAAGLHFSLEALCIDPGHEVIASAFTLDSQ